MDNSAGHILTDEQLVKMAQEGSETAEEILIEKYKSLAKGKAQIFFIVGADNEDVIQEGMIGLFKAVRSYDPDRDAAFRTYADLCINSDKKGKQKKTQAAERVFITEQNCDGGRPGDDDGKYFA